MVNMDNVEKVKTFLRMLEDENCVLEDCMRFLRGADTPTVPNVQAINDYISWLEEQEK
jgi:DNA gyrase/topoisomerase IV subunit A